METLRKNDKIQLDITGMASDGKGISRTNTDLVVFVKNTVTGDLVNAEITKIKRKFAEASVFEIIKKSQYRTEPECRYFGVCNGCKLQNTKYQYQMEIKRKFVLDAFERIGGFKNLFIPEVIGSDNIYFYRNKIEFSFSNNRWLTDEDRTTDNPDRFALGFHMPGYIDKVLDLKVCYLQSDISNNILNLTRDFFKSKQESIYTTKTHSGFLRYLVIRKSFATSEILVNLITSSRSEDRILEYSHILQKNIPEISTFIHSISTSKAQVANSEQSSSIFGDGCITEYIDKYKFKITAGSFFQTNSLQTKKLFDAVVKLADFKIDDTVLDLYCGAGAISIYISSLVNHITGVDLSNESITDASENCELNHVRNCEFISHDVKDYLRSILDSGIKKFNTIILDPPRSGIHPKAVEYLNNYGPDKIIYVSCNPSTQARDVKLLSEKYDINAIQAIDMFPQTYHVENVVRLDRK